jgi:hypothetical protein
METKVLCPTCNYDYCHIIAKLPEELYHRNFRQGCRLALLAHCEADRHEFIILIGQDKGNIIIETEAVKDYGGEVIVTPT